jgi:oxygen-dependent protoporphyrinogen oxidase
MAHIAVIGAGISGLAAAYRLQAAGAQPTVFEASGHAGGVIRTLHEHGCLLETGPDCWAGNKPAGTELVRELGLDDELIGTREGVRRSFILHKGTLKRLPEGFFLISPMSIGALMKTDVLSFRAKLRMATELFRARGRVDDESLAAFVRRRFGREALERIAQPMIAGIYTADPEKLSLKATFPQFIEFEREYGSVIRALRSRARKAAQPEMSKAAGPRYGMFVTLKRGMGSMIDALVKALPDGALRLNTRVNDLTVQADGVRVGGERFDGAVLALPAHASASLLRDTDAELATALAAIEYAGAAVVNFIFKREQIAHAMDGIGAVIPAVEQRGLIAFSFSSVKFEGRAPEGLAIVRAFMGGALNPAVAAMPEDELVTVALNELRDLLGITGEPLFNVAASHRAAMAQYHVGHLGRVAAIHDLAAKHPRIALCGNAFDGVGTPDCVRGATQAVSGLLARITP